MMKMWERYEGFVRSVGCRKGRVRQRGGNPKKHLGHSTMTIYLALCSYLDLFVGQLKSCLKCQACGYRSTTFEVFCDLSLPIPKVGLHGRWDVGSGANPTYPECGQEPFGPLEQN